MVRTRLTRRSWAGTSEKMKMRAPHIVPLSRQGVRLKNQRKVHSGDSPYVFPGRQAQRMMSENTINAGLRALGYGSDVQVGHGFRATASTLLNEQGYDPDIIELQLAHKPRGVRAIYNRAPKLEARRLMMQEWSDYLDRIKKVST